MRFSIWGTKRHQLTCVLHDDVILVVLLLANLLLFVLLFLFVCKPQKGFWSVAPDDVPACLACMWCVRVAAPLAVIVVFLFAFYELTLFTHKIHVASFVISFHSFAQVNNREKTNCLKCDAVAASLSGVIAFFFNVSTGMQKLELTIDAMMV